MDHSTSRPSEEAILLEDAEHEDLDTLSPKPSKDVHCPARGSSDWSGEPQLTLPMHEPRRSNSSSPASRDQISRSRTWGSCQQFLPSVISGAITSCLDRLDGPRSPRPFKISPLWPSFTSLWWDSPRIRRLGHLPVIISTSIYAVTFIVVLLLGNSGCEVEGPSNPNCGVGGEACRPFQDASYAFRCPADCSRVRQLEPYTIGNQTINYRTLVIGGPTGEAQPFIDYRYRGDSYLCPAAIHAGIVPDASGGIGIIDMTGEQGNFPSVSANGITSIGSLPSFPMSFTFKPAIKTPSFSPLACKDPRWALLGLTLLYNISVSLFARSVPVFYTTIFTSAFFCVGLAVDAPEPPSFGKVMSLAFEGFLPAAFVAYAIYYLCVKRALSGLSGTIDQTVLWLGGFWIGALDNMTFDKLPVQRLIPHDIAKEPGAGIALLASLAILLVAGVGQAWAFRVEGRLTQYLLLYLIMGLVILLLIMIPNLNLRIHHYIIALLLLPGTALQTRASLIYQGLLVGLFLNGIARWGFASILQVSEELFTMGLSGPPPKLEPTQMVGNNISFTWQNVSVGYDSLSILVNDVERFRGYESSGPHTFSWARESSSEPVYFRFAYTRHEAIGKIRIGDYSNPGAWLPNNTWIPIAEGDTWSPT